MRGGRLITESRKDQLQREARRQRKLCTEWLIEKIMPGHPNWVTKAELRKAAIAELGVSKTSFDVAWIMAIERLGRHDWYEPMRRRSKGSSS